MCFGRIVSKVAQGETGSNQALKCLVTANTISFIPIEIECKTFPSILTIPPPYFALMEVSSPDGSSHWFFLLQLPYPYMVQNHH